MLRPGPEPEPEPQPEPEPEPQAAGTSPAMLLGGGDARVGCTICLAADLDAADAAATACGHTFCTSCILEWLDVGREDCPMCKEGPVTHLWVRRQLDGTRLERAASEPVVLLLRARWRERPAPPAYDDNDDEQEQEQERWEEMDQQGQGRPQPQPQPRRRAAARKPQPATSPFAAMVGSRYRCISPAFATPHHIPRGPDRLTPVEVGTIITCLEVRPGPEQRLRLRCEGGWVSYVAKNGERNPSHPSLRRAASPHRPRPFAHAVPRPLFRSPFSRRYPAVLQASSSSSSSRPRAPGSWGVVGMGGVGEGARGR